MERTLSSLLKQLVEVGQNQGRNIVWGALFTVVLVVLLLPIQLNQHRLYAIGDVVTDTIYAQQDFRIPDARATSIKKAQRIADIKTIYSFNDLLWQDYVRQMEGLFQVGRDFIDAELSSVSGDQRTAALRNLARNNDFISRVSNGIVDTVNFKVDTEILSFLIAEDFNTNREQTLKHLIQTNLEKPIVNMTLYAPKSTGYIIRPQFDLTKSNMPLVSLSEARQMMRTSALSALSDVPQNQRIILDEWLISLVADTAIRDDDAMARATQEADNIETLYFDVKRGEVIAREGDKITDQDTLTRINHVLSFQSRGPNFIFRSLSLGFFTMLFLYMLYKFGVYRSRRQKVNFALFLLLCLVLTLNVTFIRMVMMGADRIAASFSTPILQNPESLYLVLPFALGAMLVALLVGTEMAALYSIILMLFSGFLLDVSYPIQLYGLIGCFVGIYSLRQYRERTALLKSGFAIGLINIITILALSFYQEKLLNANEMLLTLSLGLVSGLLASFIASFLLPAMEALFKITTDIKLLELSNHEHPLLRKLFLNAPGTFQHSIVVGYLSEAAALAIGANSLFCRVACLYHDIGKMVKPNYFVENTDDMGKRHSTLKPHMSALVIINHVKEGIDLGRKYRLPESIIDIIPQHHGTKLIKFFYEKARASQKPGQTPVKEEEFRYTGPKPQTREAGIIMLADGIEAAARSLDEPTPGRLKGTIKAIIDSTFLDGQLDECDLTLKDLTKIADAFLKILVSMKHERIKYPGFDLDKKKQKSANKRLEKDKKDVVGLPADDVDDQDNGDDDDDQ